MPREISTDLINTLEAQEGDDIAIVFMTLTHPSLDESVLLASDVVDYILNGERYTGFPFVIALLSDDDGAPEGTVSIPNVDQRIGEWLRERDSPPMLKLEIYSLSDFGAVATVDGRPTRQHGSPAPSPEYVADLLNLRDIQCTSESIDGTLDTLDPSSEAYPNIRATKNRVPALFR